MDLAQNKRLSILFLISHKTEMFSELRSEICVVAIFSMLQLHAVCACFGEEVELTELRYVFLCVDENKGNCWLRHVCPLRASELTSLFSLAISLSIFLNPCLSVSLVFFLSLFISLISILFFCTNALCSHGPGLMCESVTEMWIN